MVEEEDEDIAKAMQFAKMHVQEEYMNTNDEELVAKMEQEVPSNAVKTWALFRVVERLIMQW